MHVPAALELWAAEHSDQLSTDTIDEVRAIATALAETDLASASIHSQTTRELDQLDLAFAPDRAERARTLLPIVATWIERSTGNKARPTSEKAPTSQENQAVEPAANDTDTKDTTETKDTTTDTADTETKDTTTETKATADTETKDAETKDTADTDDAETKDADTTETDDTPMSTQASDNSGPTPSETTATATAQEEQRRGPQFAAPVPPANDPLAAPAFLRSDRVDEEDESRLYGQRRPWFAILGSLLLLSLLAAGAILGWLWFQRSNDDPAPVEAASNPAPTESAGEPEPLDGDPTAVEPAPTATTAEPTPTPIPEAAIVAESYWADTAPILNSGTAGISSSTYVVSPSNRAVLTGHTAGITGIAISDDGRVLTSGADRRLVDWGADVTVANPDVLNVPSTLTVLERTVDQRLVAGDLDGNVTIIDLVNQSEPIVIAVHDVAISAAAELADGRLAVASVNGDVAVFPIEDPDSALELPHDNEVTAIVGLPNSSVATASVDGAIRIWPSDGSAFSEIDTLGAPATALTLLGDGRLAAASVTGGVQVFTPDGEDVIQLAGHVGAVRTLLEVDYPDGSLVLASGGDDTTIRLWDIPSEQQVAVLEGHGDIISGLDQLPDGRVVSTSGDGTGRVWDLTVPPNAPVIAPHDWNLSALHPWENDQFVTGGIDGHVLLASTAETTQPLQITQHDAPIVGLDVLQNGDVVSLDAASVLRINESSGDVSGLIELVLSPGATALAVRDSLGIATGHADGTVRLHDFGEETAAIEAHGGGVNDLITLSTGLIISAGQDNLVRVIDEADLTSMATFDLHTTPVTVLAELPDGRIASASSDGIYLWSVDDLADGHVRLNGQRGRTLSLLALPGDQLISTGDDGRVRVWDLTTPEAEPETLIDIPGIVNPYLIQADNGLFVAGAARGYVVFTPN